MKRVVTLELEEWKLAYLGALDAGGQAEGALRTLIELAVEGVERPGSWERQWLYQAFEGNWEERLEPDEEIEWLEHPRAR